MELLMETDRREIERVAKIMNDNLKRKLDEGKVVITINELLEGTRIPLCDPDKCFIVRYESIDSQY